MRQHRFYYLGQGEIGFFASRLPVGGGLVQQGVRGGDRGGEADMHDHGLKVPSQGGR